MWGPDLAPDDSVSRSGFFVVSFVDVGTSFSAVPLGSALIVDALDVYEGLTMFLTSVISSVTSKYALNPESYWATSFGVFGLTSAGPASHRSVSSHLMFILNLFDFFIRIYKICP